MRNFVLLLFFLVLFLSCPSFAFHRVNYLGELPVDRPVSIAVDHDETVYAAQKTGHWSGIVTITNQVEGSGIQIGGEDKKWKDILKNPASVAIYGDRLYVADKGLDRIEVFTKTGEFVESYGSGGDDPKEFDDPSCVVVRDGVIYVADTGNDRIQVLGQNGVFLKEIGRFDDVAQRIDDPVFLAIDHEGRIYAVSDNGKVKVYSPEGTFLNSAPVSNAGPICVDEEGVFIADSKELSIKKYTFDFKEILSFGVKGEGRAQFLDISCLYRTYDGRIMVSDPERNLIQIFKPESDNSRLFGPPAPPPTSAMWTKIIGTDPGMKLSGLALKDDGTIFAIDKKTGEVCMLENGRMIRTITDEEARPAEAVAFDGSGGMYLLSGQRITKILPDGRTAYAFGGSREKSSWSSSSRPNDIAISRDGAVYVTDRKKKAVNVYNTDGVFIRKIATIDGKTPISDPAALAVNSKNMLCLLDSGNNSISIFDSNGSAIKSFNIGDPDGKPVDLAVAGENLYVLDKKRNSIKMFQTDGKQVATFSTQGTEPGDLDEPSSIAATGINRFMVTDCGNNRIQEFEVIYTPPPPDNVTAEGEPGCVTLKWDSAANPLVDGYAIYRAPKEGGTGSELIAKTKETVYRDESVEPGITYIYAVTALVSSGNESAISEKCTASAQKLVLAPPAGLVASPDDLSVELSWQPDPSPYVTAYVIYRDKQEIARVSETSFVDTGLAPETGYVYEVASVGRDGSLSEPASVTVTTLVSTRPPVEIEVLELSDIFSNTYKTYEENGIGKIRVRNNTPNNISRLNVQFTIKNFMDFASETSITDLGPGRSVEIPLKAVFNNKILDVTEDTPVQTQITASYYVNGELKSFATKQSINVYEKHKMTWDDPNRLGAFVTTKDPVVMEFVRGIITQYDHTSDPLICACLVHDALGAAGVRYTRDPSNSYQKRKENVDLVDYLQYPRETLKRKSGDCDDLSILYSACLESVGIQTRFVEVPGHIFIMFELGDTRDLGDDSMNELLVIEDGRVWVPVEVTRVGKSFSDAWEAGSRNYYTCRPDELATVDLHDAWQAYKPANLPVSSFRMQPVQRQIIDKRFDNEFAVICKTSVKIKNRNLFERLQKDPKDSETCLQLGIAYAKYGVLDEAMAMFEASLENAPDNAAAFNNIGNIRFVEGKYDKAVEAYKKAASLDPGDPLVLVNLARALIKTGQKAEAKKTFDKACSIYPDIVKDYRGLWMKLIGTK